jgi:hypothetical protein
VFSVCLQPVFLRLAFSGALVLFVLLEMVRLHRIPPLAAPVDTFLHRFTDARDSGPLVVRSAPSLMLLITYCQTLLALIDEILPQTHKGEIVFRLLRKRKILRTATDSTGCFGLEDRKW